MSNQIIRAELSTKLKDWAATQTPPIPVAYEGVAFTKPVNFGTFIECFLIPAVTINPTVSAVRTRYLGIWQVLIWTKNGSGTKVGETIADGIIALYPVVPKIGQVSIEKPPSAATALTEIEGYRVTPISIEYRAEF